MLMKPEFQASLDVPYVCNTLSQIEKLRAELGFEASSGLKQNINASLAKAELLDQVSLYWNDSNLTHVSNGLLKEGIR